MAAKTLLACVLLALMLTPSYGYLAYGNKRNRGSRALPNFTYRGGPLMEKVKVVNIWWNSNVNNQNELDALVQSFVNSNYFDWLSEYSAGGQTIGRGTYGGSYNAASSATSVTEAIVIAKLQNMMNTVSGFPQPNKDTLYQIYFDTGTTVQDTQGAKSCIDFCGYHGSYNLTGVETMFSIINDCSSGCGGSSPFEAQSITATHEIVESVTDPSNFVWGWYDNNNGEIADICPEASFTNTVDGKTWVVNSAYSRNLGACTVTGSTAVSNSASSLRSPLFSLLDMF